MAWVREGWWLLIRSRGHMPGFGLFADVEEVCEALARIARSAHVRQRIAFWGAVGLCASHFGFSSIVSSLVLCGEMSATRRPCGSDTVAGR